ncbi:hypothetical protein CH299_28005 [Rhodococcus sp. 14-2686-1-2]|nr:hypothetical protein CH301_27485 [Rhodococcus sp. 15-1189-1-1a]OZF08311.1 hypothetical protein CH299_28005 [Rhodococcus sp. 14-2686-1-2]
MVRHPVDIASEDHAGEDPFLDLVGGFVDFSELAVAAVCFDSTRCAVGSELWGDAQPPKAWTASRAISTAIAPPAGVVW